MKKVHIIVLVIFGFLLMPNNTFACGDSCGSSIEKHSCKKETSSNQDKDSCCGNDSHSKTKNHNGCGGKCGHSKCACPSTSNGFTLASEFILKNNSLNLSSEKQKFSSTETFISSGFYSLWVIPKIS
ncbi:hypothetical protein [Flavobacterium sp.]|uniref:hypothetical protein n=1 Tax=Flavobacterium sp. TaxID=239 RepID=UPI00286CB945|nr:hypothetical protein [Flavobacterium sp.]